MGWLSGLVSSGVGNGIGASASMVSLAGGVSSRLLSVLSSGFLKMLSSLGGALSSVLRFAVSLPRAVMDGIGRLSESVLGALGHVASTLSGLLGGAARVGVASLGGALAALVAVTGKAVASFTTLGRSITDLSASSGLSTGAAGATTQRFAALGMDAGQLFSGQNAAMFGMRAGLWNLPGFDDPRFATSAAARFQGMQANGPLGQMMSQQMLSSLGLQNEAGRRLVSTPISQIAEQQNYASSVQSSLGLDPARMASITRQWDTLTNKAQTLTSSVLLKLADEALPHLNRALDVLTQIGAQYAGGIGGMIERGTAMFVQGVQSSFTALVQLGNFLNKTLPSAALGFAASMIQGILQVVSAVPALWESFLVGISVLQSALQPLLSLLSNLATEAPQVLNGLWQSFLSGVDSINAGLLTVEQLGGRVFNAVLSALDRIWASPLVQQIVTALPAAKTIAEAAGGALNTAHRVVENIGNAVGLPPEWSALLGLGVPALALRGVGGMLGGGGIGGGLLRGAGALWGGAMANPLTRPLIDGAVLGGVGYTALQRSGALGKEAPGFWEAGSNVVTRIGNLWNGRDYNQGVTQMRGTDAQHTAALAAAQARNPANQVADMARAGLGDVQATYANNLAAVRAGRRTIHVDSSQADGNARGPLGALANIGDWFNGAVQQGTSARGSWAQGLDDRFGGQMRDGVATTTSRLEEALAMTLGKKSEVDVGGELSDLMAKVLAELKGIKQNTKNEGLTQAMEGLMNKYGAIVVGEAMYRFGQSEYLSLIS